MPELPEVETLKRELVTAVTGKKIDSIEVRWPKMIQPLAPAELNRRLRGQKITAVSRRAKILILELASGEKLLIHLKLTGQLIFSAKGGPPPDKFSRLVFYFSDGAQLFFNDLRKFGWVKLVSKNEAASMFAGVGIEPLNTDFTFKKFSAVLERYPRRKIKQLLMDQTLIAGLGNIYADESCFKAKILPNRPAGSLVEKEKKALYRAIIAVLKLAISKRGTSADTYVQLDGSPGGFVPYLRVYGRDGEKCRVCGALIKKIKLHGRGTHFCPLCQK